MRAALAFAICIGLGGLGTVAFGETIQIPTASESGIRISITRPFATQGGYVPLRVSIRNRGGRSGQWTFDFTGYRGVGTTHQSRTVLEVPAGEERDFDIVVPLASPPGESSPVNVRASGTGIESASWEQPIVQYGYGDGLRFWIAASQSLQPRTGLDARNAFDPGLLPSDWRGYLSLSLLAITEDELAGATPEQRRAVLEWTARGGTLVRIGSESPSTEAFGLGQVVRAYPPADPATWAPLFSVSGSRPSVSYQHWTRQMFTAIAPPSGLLLTFLVGYAVLIGPVNLFVFCSKERRGRLFWTMPTIALGASLFLSVLVVLQDGIGGRGYRVVLVTLVPEITREVVVQEQVSRTGALLRRSFTLDEPVALFDVSTGTTPPRGEFVSSARSFGGSWFQSRTIQAQRVEAIRPSRARVEWAGEGRIHSSVEAPLEEMFYRDEDGRVFHAYGITPGKVTTLEPSSEIEYQKFRSTLMGLSGPVVRGQVDALSAKRGVFLARARAGAIETLGGIDWDDTVIYAGSIGGPR